MWRLREADDMLSRAGWEGCEVRRVQGKGRAGVRLKVEGGVLH